MEKDKVNYTRYMIRNTRTYDEVSDIPHEVPYIERKKNKRAKSKLKSKGKGMKSRLISTLYTICIIVLITLVTILLADIVRGGYVLSEIHTLIKGKADIIHTYYAVETASFEEIDEARLYANRMRNRMGAGYVIHDEGYRVLLEVYDGEDEAESIVKKLKLDGENAKVYPFEIARIDYLKLPEKTRNIAKSSIEYNDRAYRTIYQIGLDLARDNIDENSAKLKVKGVLDETRNVIAEFVANVDDKIGDKNIIKIKAELESIEATIDNLSKDIVKRPNLLADIRYTSCLIANAYRELSRELSA